jgi:hypothetical protein
MAFLPPLPMLQHKVRTFTRAFLQKPFLNKFVTPETNLATLMNLDIKLRHGYHLKCLELLDNVIGVAPAYKKIPELGTMLLYGLIYIP